MLYHFKKSENTTETQEKIWAVYGEVLWLIECVKSGLQSFVMQISHWLMLNKSVWLLRGPGATRAPGSSRRATRGQPPPSHPTRTKPVLFPDPGRTPHCSLEMSKWPLLPVRSQVTREDGAPGCRVGHLPDPGIEAPSPMYPVLAGGFFTTGATWEAIVNILC